MCAKRPKSLVLYNSLFYSILIYFCKKTDVKTFKDLFDLFVNTYFEKLIIFLALFLRIYLFILQTYLHLWIKKILERNIS